MSDTGTSRWEQLNESGRLLFLAGDLIRAAQAFGSAVAEAEREGDALRLSSSLGNLAQLRYQQRELAEAEALFTRAIALREQALGAEHASVSQPLNNLAALHVARGELAQAEPLLVRALAILERHRPPNHPDVAVALNNLAKLYFKRGHHAAAEPLLLRLLAAKRAAGDGHPEVAAVLASIATLRLATGRPAEAEAMWRQALDIRERTLAPNDPALAPTLEGLADACAAQDRPDEALALRERALAIRVAALGGEHASVASARARIAELRQTAVPPSPTAQPSVAAEAPSSGPRPGAPHAPRLSALRMTALDDEAVARLEGRVPDEPARPGIPEAPLVNAWLLESEPPSHIIDGGGTAVASPPRRTPPFTPAVPRPSAAVPKPVALQNSQLQAPEERAPAPAAAATETDADVWWSGPTAPPAPALPPEPRAEPRSSGTLRAPGRSSGALQAPVPGPTQPPARQSAAVAPDLVAASETQSLEERRAEEWRSVVARPAREETTAPRDESRRASVRRPESASRWPLAMTIAVTVLLAAGLWVGLARRPSADSASGARSDASVAAASEERIAVPAPTVRPAPVAPAEPALGTQLPEFRLDSAPIRVGGGKGRASISDAIVPGLAVERVVRAIDDSARTKVEQSVKLRIEPPSINEP